MKGFPSSFFLEGAAFVFLTLVLTCVESPARLWTTVTGRTFEAEFIRVDGPNASSR
jgi:hypothetical protein